MMNALILIILSVKVAAITPKEVVDSSLKHYPVVIENLLEIEKNENQVKESQGLFDAKLKGEMDNRTEGYYTGDAYKALIEKSFPILNSKIYGGVRQSYGSFPDYEGKFETLSGGEAFAGLSLSLLRNSLIDFKRYELRLNKQNLKQAEIELKNIKISVQSLALNAYWNWVIKSEELKVYQNILELAQKRAGQIKRRIKVGDLAKIYENENLQYILKRESQVLKSQIEFQKAQYYLSLFYRNNAGAPHDVTKIQIPVIDNLALSNLSNREAFFEKAKRNNLELQKIESQRNQASLDVQMGNNEILPKVDLNVEWNQDQGVGPNRLGQDENRVMVNVEIPIEYNKGLGKKRSGKAKLDQLDVKKEFVIEKLKVQTNILYTKINNLVEIFKINQQQVKMAELLAQAELRKFTQGSSDLILVNLREESLADAQIEKLESLLKYNYVKSETLQICIDFL